MKITIYLTELSTTGGTDGLKLQCIAIVIGVARGCRFTPEPARKKLMRLSASPEDENLTFFIGRGGCSV